jgi:hypothetical protein
MKFFTLILLMSTLIISTANAQEIKKTASQRTWWAVNQSESDLIELSDLFEPGFPSYTTITIYRNNKKIFSFHDPKGEFYIDKEVFTEHRFADGKQSYLIFSCSGRPGYDYYFVLLKSESGYSKLGYTHSSSAEIFGDIDNDDIFEIGGFESAEISGNTIEEKFKNIANDYKIFEVRQGFPLDKPLMDALLPIVIMNSRVKYKSEFQNSK